ncbi:NAD(P)-dependent alcohol dehydrogenase [Hymenobacter sp. BT175]|uniref:NAD(P)-dependent alcohol dehydrogenase n=1 Tax=Hymenobacter translucens TaxID=2886507 RepID=UPI001D0E463C|nr:NAD(P)-dependent alcohol dehydrogenase [Hymenobacter translucens]MCC2547173.1 NAD(P)-dependent alcohol dehydrogenase [Hymenobacter translucens]
MRAAVNTSYGPPEVVTLADVQKPVPGEQEVLIKVYAATVNRTDCAFRSAEYIASRLFSGLFKPKNHILGNEFAGQVEAVGGGVTQFAVGDMVFGYNDQQFGAHAEYLTMPEQGCLSTMPAGLTYEQAAPLCEGGHYALCDIRAAKVKAGQHVLVYGATGAIGSAAVQLLRHFGASVTAVCDTRNVELVKSLGAHTVIDYTRADYTQAGQTYDFVFDTVGKSSFGQARKVLGPQGIYISTELGKRFENIFYALNAPFSRGPKVLFPIPSMSQADVVLFRELVESRQYRALIDRRYPLEQIVEAYRYVETRQKIGNVVITFS